MATPVELGLVTFGDVGADESAASHARTLREVVAEAELADAVGVDIFGVGEHHRPDFAISSPEVLLGAIATRTRRIRISSAVTNLSTDDPVRVFQRFSTLHAISRGRAQVVLGRGWFTESFALFGYSLADYEKLFDEKLDLFAALLRRKVVSWQGTTRAALVKQSVYPRLESALETWIAVGSTPESVLRAARYDMPMVLAVISGEASRFQPFIDIYHQAFEKLGRPVKPLGLHANGYIADTDEQAREEFWAGYKTWRDTLGAERGWGPLQRKTYDLEVDRGALYVGAPETVARKIAANVKALGASRFEIKYSVGALPHAKRMRSIELYGGKVAPLVRDMLA